MSYPTTSRAAVLPDFGKPVEVRDIAVPQLAEDAMLVRVEAATMCGTDGHIADGGLAKAGVCRVPLVLGHEMVGRIVALGTGRRTDALNRPLAEGDLIAWTAPWCDRCYWCTIAKQPTLCVNAMPYGFGPADRFPHLTGGFAEYCYVQPRSRAVLVPEGLPAPLASSATCALRTVVHAFEALGTLRPTDTVVIQGAGAVGLYALAYARVAGAGRIAVIGAPAARLALASRWGADIVLDLEGTTGPERQERVRDLTDGRGADVVVECSGAAVAFPEGLDLLRKGGRYVVVGASDPRPTPVPITAFNLRMISVVGTVSADISHFWRALEFLVRNDAQFGFAALLGDTYPLDDVDVALEAIRAGAMKPVITS